jgi:LysM repeat protein
MRKRLRSYLERFWVWLGGEPPAVESGVSVEPSPGQFEYVMQPGDTLSNIARRFGTSVWILADLNNLDAPGSVRVGQRLLIPRPGASPATPSRSSEAESEPPSETDVGPFLYIVQTGDTLNSIAGCFNVAEAAILEINRIQAPDLIRPGQRLLIPGLDSQLESEPAASPEVEPGPEPTCPESKPIPLPLPGLTPEQVAESGSVPAPRGDAVLDPSSAAMSEARRETASVPQPDHVYVVQPEDTLLTIARRFNVTLWALIEANDIEDPNLIQPGLHLIIPGIALPPTPAASPGPAPLEPTPSPRPPDGLWPIPWPDEAIRGIYVSYFALGHEARRRRVSDLLTRTEINALVIDVKGDNGLISYPTRVPLAHEIGAARPTARDFDELMDFFKANNVYTIARIVTFKDHLFACAHPGWAVQREGGGLWHDQGERAWANPFVWATWEYNADLAEEAAHRGFDEIQFDFVRFPVPSQEGAPLFPQSSSRVSPVEAVTDFLSYVRGRLSSLEVRVAANVFGYVCWHEDATFVGQDIKRMADYLDVLCPKLYPSTFGRGIPGYEYAIAYPYEIVHESMKRLADQVSSSVCRVRPWIQDFPDFRFDKRVYGPDEVRAQMRGSFDGGGDGYMAWDPKNSYTVGAYFQKTIDMSLSDDYN